MKRYKQAAIGLLLLESVNSQRLCKLYGLCCDYPDECNCYFFLMDKPDPLDPSTWIVPPAKVTQWCGLYTPNSNATYSAQYGPGGTETCSGLGPNTIDCGDTSKNMQEVCNTAVKQFISVGQTGGTMSPFIDSWEDGVFKYWDSLFNQGAYQICEVAWCKFNYNAAASTYDHLSNPACYQNKHTPKYGHLEVSNDIACVGHSYYSMTCQTGKAGTTTSPCGGRLPLTTNDKCIEIWIKDVCDPPVVLTPQVPTPVPTPFSYEARRDYNSTATAALGYPASTKTELGVPVSGFISITNDVPGLCKFTQCKVVKTDPGPVCPTNILLAQAVGPPEYFKTVLDPTTQKLDFWTDTTVIRPKTSYCIACQDSNRVGGWHFAGPFTHEVVQADCTNDIKLINQPMTTPWDFIVPPTLVGTPQLLFDNSTQPYAVTEDPTNPANKDPGGAINGTDLNFACPMEFELIDTATGLPYASANPIAQIDKVTGKVTYNDNVLTLGTTLKVRVKTIPALSTRPTSLATQDVKYYELDSSAFTIKNQCEAYVQQPIIDLWTMCLNKVQATPSPKVTLVDKASTTTFDDTKWYINPQTTATGSDQSVCPVKYTFMQSGAIYAGSLMTITPSNPTIVPTGSPTPPKITMDINTLAQEDNLHMQIRLPDTTPDTTTGVTYPTVANEERFSARVVCCDDQNYQKNPGTTLYPADLVNQTVQVDSPPYKPSFNFSALTLEQLQCPIERIDFYDCLGNVANPAQTPPITPAPGLLPASLIFPGPTPPYQLALNDPGPAAWQNIDKYPFAMKITLKGYEPDPIANAGVFQKQVFWYDNGAGNQCLELDVICGPKSTSYTEDTANWCCNLPTPNETQWWDKGFGNCFILPPYINANPKCPTEADLTVNYTLYPTIATLVPAAPTQPINPATLPDYSADLLEPVWDATLGAYKVCPVNDNLDAIYEFTIYKQARGGAEFMSQKYKWIHGCPNPMAVFQHGLNFKVFDLKYIGRSRFDAWVFDGTANPQPNCRIEKLEIVDLQYRTIYQTWFTPAWAGMSKAVSCPVTDPCNFFDLDWIDHAHDIRFRIKVHMTNNQFALTNFVDLQVRCDSQSATLISTVTTPVYINITQDEEGWFSFDPFTCTPYDCCLDREYLITTDTWGGNNGNPDQRYRIPQYDNNPLSPTFGKYKFKLYSGQVGNHTIYIQHRNKFNTWVYSSPITINVKYNCTYAWIDFNYLYDIRPEELAPIEEKVLWDHVWDERNNLEMEIMQYKYGNKLDFNVRERFISNVSWDLCPISNCYIYRVQEVDTQREILPRDWDDRIDLQPNCNMHLERMNNPYNVMLWANVSNGKVWLKKKHPFMRVRIIEPWREPYNWAPLFTAEVKADCINVTYDFWKDEIHTIQLPPIIDYQPNDTHKIVFEKFPLPNWMQLDNNTFQIKINKTAVPDSIANSSELYRFNLTDHKGAYTQYNITICMFREWKRPPPPPPPGPPEPVCRNGYLAFIHHIDIWGLMEIRFNSTMFTDFNFSQLGPSTLDIYVEPSYTLPKDFNLSRLNFTWKLEYYKNQPNATDLLRGDPFSKAAMGIRMNWSDPLAISPYSVQDLIVVHVKRPSKAFYSPELNTFVGETCSMKFKIRKQLTWEWKEWMDLTERIHSWLSFMLYFTYIFANLPVGSGFRYYFFYLRSLTYVIHFPMLNTVFPANAMRYFEVCFPVVRFDVIPKEWLTMTWFWFNQEEHRAYAVKYIHDQDEDLGYNTMNALVLLNCIWLFMMIYVIRVILYYMVKAYKRWHNFTALKNEGGDDKEPVDPEKVNKWRAMANNIKQKPMYIKAHGKIIKYMVPDDSKPGPARQINVSFNINCLGCMTREDWKECWRRFVHFLQNFLCDLWRWTIKTIWGWRNHLFFCTIIGLLLESYMEWCVAGIYNMKDIVYDWGGDKYGNFMGVACYIIAFALIPGLLLFLYQFPDRYMWNKRFHRKWGYVFLELKKRTNIHRWYFGFYVMRRIQFFWFVFDISWAPTLQLVLMMVQCLFFHWYVGTKPFQSKILRYLYYFEEAVILAAVGHICVFTDWGATEKAMIGWGWSLIIVISLHFIIVCMWIYWVFLCYCYLLYLRWQAQFRVFLVRAVGFRVGGKHKDRFDLTIGDRLPRQMMELVENQNKDNLTAQIAEAYVNDNVDPKAKQILNHLPHMIERFRGNPGITKQETKPSPMLIIDEQYTGPPEKSNKVAIEVESVEEVRAQSSTPFFNKDEEEKQRKEANEKMEAYLKSTMKQLERQPIEFDQYKKPKKMQHNLNKYFK